MSDPAESLRETILRQCEASGQTPWYPKLYAEQHGADRESLYGPLNDLRIANLVELTEWVEGKGQGYLITPVGREVLADPLFLSQLRAGKAAAPQAAAAPLAPAETRFERGEVARSAFYLPGKVRVTPVLILLNVLAFSASIAVAAREGVPVMRFIGSGDPLVLDKIGGLSVVGLARGEWWRLISNTFLHFGFLHLATNMVALYLLRRVEALWGSGRFLVLYLICGLCGSCAGVYISPAEADKIVILAGASGAIWGLMMSEVGWLALNRTHLPPADVRLALQNIVFVLVLNGGVSMLPNVSAGAHFGGGAAGFLCSLLLQVHRFGPASRRTMAGMLLALTPTLALLALSAAMENDHRLQPFVLKEFRNQLDDRVGRLPPAFEPAEKRAEALYAKASDNRDAAEVGAVRDDLRRVLGQAKDAGEWVNRSNPPAAAKPLKEAATKLVETLTAYAEALEKRAASGDTSDVTEPRKAYQEAKSAWDVAIAK